MTDVVFAGPRVPRFPPAQRRVLLLEPGVGEGVVQRLEAAGYASLEVLQAAGVRCATQSAGELRNRCRALERALARLQALQSVDPEPSR